jgi:hypothetical protein
MPKTEFLQIRCSPEERQRMKRLALAEHLDLSTWARRVLMQSVDRWEDRAASRLKVAETGPEFSGRAKDKRK